MSKNENVTLAPMPIDAAIARLRQLYPDDSPEAFNGRILAASINGLQPGDAAVRAALARFGHRQTQAALGGFEPSGGQPATATATADDCEQSPALTRAERRTLLTLAAFDPAYLASVADIVGAMDVADRLGDRTTRAAITCLIELDLAERPEGEKSGARLTANGRRLAPKITD